MDKLKKALRKQSLKNRLILRSIFEDILRGQLEGYDIVRLTGIKNIFRLRKGNFRIIFQKNKNGLEIIRITTRDDKTYKKLG